MRPVGAWFAAAGGGRYKPIVRGFSPEMAGSLIERLARAHGGPLQEPVRSALIAYAELVARWNAKVNLTAASDPQSLIEILMADAFVLADLAFVPQDACVLDIGTGAGAPIVPLLLLRPDVTASCVEPLGKRATFLRTISARLALLARMRVREERLEPAAPDAHGEHFDVACSRATFEPAQWLTVGLSLAPRVLVLLASAQPPPAPQGARLLVDRAYALPFSAAPRRACCYLRE